MQTQKNNPTESTSHWDGADYSKNSQMQYDVATALLNAHVFRGDENVLDIGCGDGKISRVIAAKVHKGKVLGIDASQSMIETALHGIGMNPPRSDGSCQIMLPIAKLIAFR